MLSVSIAFYDIHNIQGGAKVGLKLVVWKIIQQLINDIRLSPVFHVLTAGNLLLPTLCDSALPNHSSELFV